MINVVFFTDREMLPGLHVAIRSLLTSSSTKPFRVTVFAVNLGSKDKSLILKTFEDSGSKSKLEINDFATRSPLSANSLHGNNVTYGRLYIAELLKNESSCVYIDSDVLINVDVAELDFELKTKMLIMADGDGVREYALDRELFIRADLDMAGPCFNAGVLWIDLDKWRSIDASAMCEQISKRYPGQFLSADQALLNVAFHDQFGAFGTHFNKKISPSDPTLGLSETGIFHFVGSPKPWDVFGRYLHNSYTSWEKVYLQTAIGDKRPSSFTTVARRYQIRRSLIKTLLRRFS